MTTEDMKTRFLEAAKSVVVEDKPISVKDYRLMYYVGVWMTSERFCAESDEEAIFDADMAEKKASDRLQYTLWCGNRKVKNYPKPINPWIKFATL